jgi:hypothetical protein
MNFSINYSANRENFESRAWKISALFITTTESQNLGESHHRL